MRRVKPRESTRPRDVQYWTSVTTIAFNCFTVIAIFGGFYQFSEQVEAKRTEQSIAMVGIWEEDGYKDSYELLERALFQDLASLPEDHLAYLNSPEESVRKKARFNLGRQVADALGADKSRLLDSMFYYFNKLAICIDNKLCSKKASHAFLFETVSSFWMYFGWYAEDKRNKGYYGFASEAELFSLGKLR